MNDSATTEIYTLSLHDALPICRRIVLVETLKLFPLVFIYMNGAFKNIDNSLLKASTNLGCVGVNRLLKIILRLCIPTILAASLLVFMRSFADFGTPLLLGEGVGKSIR